MAAVGSNNTPTDAGVVITVPLGKKLLFRYITAGYCPQKIRFINAAGLGPIKVIAEDGRPLATPETWPLTSGEANRIATSAERLEFHLTPTAKANYKVQIDFLHWVTGAVIGSAYSYIKVI